MTRPSPVAYAALIIALLSIFSPFAGVAEASGHKIGKNLVVTKSIKNGAVTGKKVKDGSLSMADLAPGTIPAPANGKSVVMAGCVACLNTGALQTTLFTPGGSPVPAVYLTVPVTVQVMDFRVGTDPQGAGQSVTFGLLYRPPGAAADTEAVQCTVASGQRGCSGSTTTTLPAGSTFYVQARNGAGGAAGNTVQFAYTVRVP